MLKSLKIKNLALISDLTLEFQKGFNVLLGETGAGKSIILDALHFVLGAKSDKGLISFNEKSMRVEACFEDYNQQISRVLDDFGIEDEGIIIISRTLSIDGKSDVKLNGNSLTLGMLKSISAFLVDSYSQHENMLLLKEKNQLAILDSFAVGVDEYKVQLNELLEQKKDIKAKINLLGGDGEARNRELDFLKYQISEIKDLNPSAEEEKNLQERFNIFASNEKITNALESAYANLNHGVSVLGQLKTAQRDLQNIGEFSEKYENLSSRLDDCYYEIQDIATSIHSEIEDVVYDEAEFNRIDSRLDKYKDLKRKYGNSVQEIVLKLDELEKKYALISDADSQIEIYNNQLKSLDEKIINICSKLSELRKKTASNFERDMICQFADLGMKNAKFCVQFENIVPGANGSDEVKFMFCANLGEDLKPLSKIISGGELSRFMLAYKNLNVKDDATVVFDEIDTGISGDIGSAVAKKIANIARFNQVICISHLPQVCSMADNFFYVYKQTVDEKTHSNVQVLSDVEKAEKIAKLIGGDSGSTVALEHARQLLDWAYNYKKSI